MILFSLGVISCMIFQAVTKKLEDREKSKPRLPGGKVLEAMRKGGTWIVVR